MDKDNLDKIDFLEKIISKLPGLVYCKSIDGVYLSCNEAQAKIIGFSSEKDVIGKTDFEFLTKEEATRLTNRDKLVMSEDLIIDSAHPIEETIVLPNGKIGIFESIKIPFYDDGKILGLIGLSRDITELKKTQEALITAKETAENALESLQKSQIEEQKQRKEAERLNIENTKHKAELEIAKIAAEKEQEMRKTVMVLVGDIVHDLYTPLAIIEDGANILESISSELNEVIKEADNLNSEKLSSLNRTKLDYVINEMSTCQKDSIRMIHEFIDTTIRELLVIQKYQDGSIAHEELTRCSSRRVLENVMDSYPHRTGITIHQSFPYDFFFMGNSILMMKVLFNLIRNAEEQIITNGKGEIIILTKETYAQNLLIVKDTAGGAPPEVVENFFKGFFTTKKTGSGIGLAFCKKIMQNFGGDLTCKSIFGESMEFILSFPKINSN